MSTLQRATRNSAVMMAQQVVTWGATFTLMAVLARYLGDARFGTLFLAMSFAVIFAVLVNFGLDEQLVRGIARDRAATSKYLVNSIILKVFSSLVAYGLILVSINVLNYDTTTQLTIAVYCLVLLFDGISNSLTGVFQAFERLSHAALATIIEKVSIMIGALALVWFGFGVVEIAGVYVLGSVLAMLWKAAFVLRMADVEFTFSRTVAKRLVVSALPFFMFWTLGSVYHRIDAVMLQSLADAAVVGWYGSAYRLFDTLGFLPFIVSTTIMLPILSRISQDSSDNLRYAASKGLNVILIIGIPVCVGMALLASPIIQLVFGGGAFLNAVPAMQLLALALLLLYINSIFSSLIISVNLESRMTLVAAFAVLINVGLNFIFIPMYQHIAAAATTVVTEFFILSCLLYFVPRDVRPWQSVGTLVRSGAAAGVMAVVLFILGDLHLVLLVPIGATVYLAAALLLQAAPPEDLRMLRDAISRRGGQESVEGEASNA